MRPFDDVIEQLVGNARSAGCDDARLAAAQPRVLLDATQAARLLTIKQSTVLDHARRGVLPCVRIGSLVRFDQAELVAWIDEQRRDA